MDQVEFQTVLDRMTGSFEKVHSWVERLKKEPTKLHAMMGIWYRMLEPFPVKDALEAVENLIHRDEPLRVVEAYPRQIRAFCAERQRFRQSRPATVSGETVYRCATCLDTGMVVIFYEAHGGVGTNLTAQAACPCPTGREAVSRLQGEGVRITTFNENTCVRWNMEEFNRRTRELWRKNAKHPAYAPSATITIPASMPDAQALLETHPAPPGPLDNPTGGQSPTPGSTLEDEPTPEAVKTGYPMDEIPFVWIIALVPFVI